MAYLSRIAFILIGFVAFQHIAFLVLQIFLWEHEIGMGVFNTTIETAKISAALAKQQGLYNGFLAAGLIYGLFAKKGDFLIFFLLCVMAAGIFGALTVKPSIFMVQALPAILALGIFMKIRNA